MLGVPSVVNPALDPLQLAKDVGLLELILIPMCAVDVDCCFLFKSRPLLRVVLNQLFTL